MSSLESHLSSTPGGHADDAILTRFVDGESLSEERAAVAHAVGCDDCQARIDKIRQRRARLSEILATTDAPAVTVPNVTDILAEAERRAGGAASSTNGSRRARGRRPTRRAVVVSLVLLSGAALAAQPMTKWVLARWQRPAPREHAPKTVADSPTAAAAATIAFVPQSSEFTIRFDAVPALGTLTLVSDTGSKVTATITTGAGDEGFFVLPDGIRIKNTTASRATYRVSVPAALHRVRVQIGTGATAATVVVGLEPGRTHNLQLR
jgi:hypothetical protein